MSTAGAVGGEVLKRLGKKLFGRRKRRSRRRQRKRGLVKGKKV